jgi:predicted DCC family thiol-disulfide oxidoreductase YuxK
VKSAVQVSSPPPKPLLIFDGDCRFCRRWISRWSGITGDRVDYLPMQDLHVAHEYPELTAEQLGAAVHLVEPDGTVYLGAEAALRTLACNPREQWLLDWYEHSPRFAGTADWAYRLVARHRGFFSVLTRIGWGERLEPPTHLLVRSVFVRLLGLIYLIAFVSLWTQITGLVGSRGILPASVTMQLERQQATAAHVGLNRYHLFPTLCWFSARDGFLKGQCAAGVALAVLVIIGIAPAPALFLLWLIYLSLCSVCREFLSFQWDILLLETGFLAIFVAPLQLLQWRSSPAPPSRLVLWLLRWLLFRLMFESGCVKLLSGDPTWRNLTALQYHYWTQPLPTWIGWYAGQLPAKVQQASTLLMFVIELAVPFLIFAPRRLRLYACGALVTLQILILLTGNYCFFNLLTIALCLCLLDDLALQRLVPRRWRRFLQIATPNSTGRPSPIDAPSSTLDPRLSLSEPCPAPPSSTLHPPPSRLSPAWPRQITVPLACVVAAISLIQASVMFRVRLPWPGPVLGVYQWLAPLRTFNTYGLFMVMTTTRPEVIIEGSNDGTNWLAYEFKYKPGALDRRPGFVEPHQPRLDWQMWTPFLGNLRQNEWLPNFCFRLLQGSPDVLQLLGHNPFPKAPPRYIRAMVYDYHFTDLATRRKTGRWWRREQKGLYLPPASLNEK